MAASSVNFAANQQDLPSIFEISAAEFLDKLLYPAIKRVFDFCGLKCPLKIGQSHMEFNVSPIFVMALQYLYLKKRGGSFGESFYGLQRIVDKQTSSIESNSKPFVSAALLTLLPYIENKLKERSAQHESNEHEKHILKSLNLLHIVKAVFTLTYLAKITSTHSPIFKLLQLRLNYSPPANDKVTFWILKSIEIFAFFLQFAQWWYTNKNNFNFGKLENPKPFENQQEIDVENGICPICLQKISNPTANGVSGYVYCWRCIMSHLRNSNTCPVTNYAISIDDLIRIYED